MYEQHEAGVAVRLTDATMSFAIKRDRVDTMCKFKTFYSIRHRIDLRVVGSGQACGGQK